MTKKTITDTKLTPNLSKEQEQQIKEAIGKSLGNTDPLNVNQILKTAPTMYQPGFVQGPQGLQLAQGGLRKPQVIVQ